MYTKILSELIIVLQIYIYIYVYTVQDFHKQFIPENIS